MPSELSLPPEVQHALENNHAIVVRTGQEQILVAPEQIKGVWAAMSAQDPSVHVVAIGPMKSFQTRDERGLTIPEEAKRAIREGLGMIVYGEEMQPPGMEGYLHLGPDDVETFWRDSAPNMLRAEPVYVGTPDEIKHWTAEHPNG